MFTSLRSRLIAVYLGMIFIGFGGLTLWTGIQMANDVYRDFGTNLQVHTVQLATQLIEPLEYNSPDVAEIMWVSAENLGGQVALFSPNGAFLSATDNQATSLTSRDQYTFQDNSSGEPTIYATGEIRDDGELLAIVQIGVPQHEAQELVSERSWRLAIGFIVISALGLGISLWLITTMTEPLLQLRNTALEMAKGDLSQRVENASRDEIGEVGTAFNEMAARVEAMVTEQRAFASNASHELRTPLTTIRLRTEALQDNLDDPELTATYVDEIDSEVQRMGNLVDDLMLLSRLDAKRMMAGNETIDAVRLLQVLQREYASQANEKAIELVISAEPTTAPVNANMNHLRVVFGNVISNAIKYTQEGGAVSVLLRQMQDRLELQVTDNGRGISSDELPNIGNRFYRADKARTRDTPGVGLGLSLVRSILDLYDGEFSIESEGLGQGTVVTISWPLA